MTGMALYLSCLGWYKMKDSRNVKLGLGWEFRWRWTSNSPETQSILIFSTNLEMGQLRLAEPRLVSRGGLCRGVISGCNPPGRRNCLDFSAHSAFRKRSTVSQCLHSDQGKKGKKFPWVWGIGVLDTAVLMPTILIQSGLICSSNIGARCLAQICICTSWVKYKSIIFINIQNL